MTFEEYARRAGIATFGLTVVMARPRMPFVLSAAAHPHRRTHMVDEVATAWTRGKLRRIAASTRCGARFFAARLVAEAPEDYALCDACVFTDHIGGATVYRLFDESGHLLYLGCSKNVLYRVLSHATADWWPLVASVTYEPYADVDAALAAEARAIVAEQPPFNKDLTDRAKLPGRRRSANLHLLHRAVSA